MSYSLDIPHNPYRDDYLENHWVGTDEYWEYIRDEFLDECGNDLSRCAEAACQHIAEQITERPSTLMETFWAENERLLEKLEERALERKREGR